VRSHVDARRNTTRLHHHFSKYHKKEKGRNCHWQATAGRLLLCQKLIGRKQSNIIEKASNIQYPNRPVKICPNPTKAKGSESVSINFASLGRF
jgi:hypothetical protein